MCLITRKTKSNVKIATKDITVWKLLRSDLSAPYFNFKYEKGKTYKTEFTYVGKFDDIIPFNDDASNFLNENYDGWYENGNDVRDKLICVAEGFHAFIKKKDAIDNMDTYFSDETIVKFTIPEGAEYIKDEHGLIVANQIKML